MILYHNGNWYHETTLIDVLYSVNNKAIIYLVGELEPKLKDITISRLDAYQVVQYQTYPLAKVLYYLELDDEKARNLLFEYMASNNSDYEKISKKLSDFILQSVESDI